jgi:dTDP-4-dehydrorhamnose 3,5-epimerase
MFFIPLGFASETFEDAFLVELDKRFDERGFFSRALCAEEFSAHGLPTHWPQVNISYNTHAGTLRGMHFQRAPSLEAKLVRCLRGGIFDVIIDLRAGSPYFGTWKSIEINDVNRRMIFIPPGFAHGYQTLQSDTELLYFHDAQFDDSCQGGVFALDPALGISWPKKVIGLSSRDESLPTLSDLEPLRP